MAMMISQRVLLSNRLQKQLFMVFPPFIKLTAKVCLGAPFCYHHMRMLTKGDGFCEFGAKKAIGCGGYILTFDMICDKIIALDLDIEIEDEF